MFLLGMERPKKAIFGCFRPIIGLFLIEYEDSGPKTCTKYVGIIGEAFWVAFGMERLKMAIFGCFRTNMGLFLIEYEGSVPETCTKSLGILGEAF